MDKNKYFNINGTLANISLRDKDTNFLTFGVNGMERKIPRRKEGFLALMQDQKVALVESGNKMYDLANFEDAHFVSIIKNAGLHNTFEAEDIIGSKGVTTTVKQKGDQENNAKLKRINSKNGRVNINIDQGDEK